jgi:hypothetical protein
LKFLADHIQEVKFWASHINAFTDSKSPIAIQIKVEAVLSRVAKYLTKIFFVMPISARYTNLMFAGPAVSSVKRLVTIGLNKGWETFWG